MNKLYASFKGNCWDLDAYKYSIRREYILSKLTFNLLIITLVIVYAINDFIKADYKNGTIALALVLAYIGVFIFLYFRNSQRFIDELKENVKHVNVEFYSDCLIVTQKSKTNNVKTKFEYKEIIRLIGKDDYFFIKFKKITLPFNKNSIVYNDSSLDDIIANMNKCIELENTRKFTDKKKAQK
jgi:hypothetical protein